MTALRDQIPLGPHRARVAQYLRGIAFPAGSVAARIIDERASERSSDDSMRPGLLLWSCDVGHGDLDDALPVAAAFDLFDRFLMLHEELADESAPAIARWGLGQSLNAGDALYALAFRTLAHEARSPGRRLQTARLVAGAVLEAIETRGAAARDAVMTGAAMQAGAVIAGVPEEIVAAFASAGRLLAAQPSAAVALLRPCVAEAALSDFEEVARYVARRAA